MYISIAICLVLTLALVVLLVELLTIARAKVADDEFASSITTGSPAAPHGSSTAPIPKIIWSYWHDPQPPPLVANCVANWRRHAPEHDIRMLNFENFSDYLPDVSLPGYFEQLPAYRQADWLRIQLLLRHGGIWMDATIFLTRSLDWVHAAQQRQSIDYVGYYIAKFTKNHHVPVVENWLMATNPGSTYLRAWADELDSALRAGSAEKYFQQLSDQHELSAGLQNIPVDQASYLCMHVASSVVLARQADAYKLCLLRAEDGPFAFHAGLRWRKRHLYVKLALLPCPARMPALVKIRGADKRVFEKLLAKGWVHPGSALAQYIDFGKIRGRNA